MKVRSKDAALILVDIQNAWKSEVWGRRNNPEAERVAGRLLEEFRKKGLRVIHVRHESVNPKSLFRRGKDTFEFQDYVMPLSGETIITKHVNSAFIGTELEELLRREGIRSILISGLVTDHCVSTTARMAGNLGFDTTIIEDACATFDRKDSEGEVIPADIVHRVNLASIKGEFAAIIKSGDIQM